MIWSTVSNALCKSTKTPQTNILLSTAFAIFSIRLITACAVEKFFEIQIVFDIEPFSHSKIPLTFYAEVFPLFYQDLIAYSWHTQVWNPFCKLLTLAIFELFGKIPVIKDKLYMKHRCSAIYSLAIFNVFMGMLFIPIALL